MTRGAAALTVLGVSVLVAYLAATTGSTIPAGGDVGAAAPLAAPLLAALVAAALSALALVRSGPSVGRFVLLATALPLAALSGFDLLAVATGLSSP